MSLSFFLSSPAILQSRQSNLCYSSIISVSMITTMCAASWKPKASLEFSTCYDFPLFASIVYIAVSFVRIQVDLNHFRRIFIVNFQSSNVLRKDKVLKGLFGFYSYWIDIHYLKSYSHNNIYISIYIE